jgi:hypothetical protein
MDERTIIYLSMFGIVIAIGLASYYEYNTTKGEPYQPGMLRVIENDRSVNIVGKTKEGKLYTVLAFDKSFLDKGQFTALGVYENPTGVGLDVEWPKVPGIAAVGVLDTLQKEKAQ